MLEVVNYCPHAAATVNSQVVDEPAIEPEVGVQRQWAVGKVTGYPQRDNGFIGAGLYMGHLLRKGRGLLRACGSARPQSRLGHCSRGRHRVHDLICFCCRMRPWR